MKIVAHGADIIARNNRRGKLHVGTLREDILIITVGEEIPVQAIEAAIHGGSTAAPDEHHVLAEFVELLLVAGTKTFA